MWISYKEDLNCSLIAVKKHCIMTLREVAEREGVSFVRIKQIQDTALKKLGNIKSLIELKNNAF